MNVERPTLEMKFPCRRELLVSSIGSIFIVVGIFGVLAFISISLAKVLDVIDSGELVMDYSSESEELEEEKEVMEVYEPSPSVSVPLLLPAPPELQVVQTPDAIPAPKIEEMPMMDDLAWSEETFEPWDEENKTEVKTESQARKSIATRKAAPSAKPASSKLSRAKVVFRISPIYPSMARRSGIEGKVIVLVTVSPSGRVSNARLTSSSGSTLLDEAALKAARRYRFMSAKDATGQAITTQATVPFTFRLK